MEPTNTRHGIRAQRAHLSVGLAVSAILATVIVGGALPVSSFRANPVAAACTSTFSGRWSGTWASGPFSDTWGGPLSLSAPSSGGVQRVTESLAVKGTPFGTLSGPVKGTVTCGTWAISANTTFGLATFTGTSATNGASASGNLTDGSLTGTWAGSTQPPSSGLNLEVAASSPPENLYLAEPTKHRVLKITPQGTQTMVGVGLSNPVAVAVDPDGNVYVADVGTNQVVKVTPSGVQSSVGSGLSSPAGIAVDANGNVFIADEFNDRVVKVTPAGVQTTVVSGLTGPDSVAVDAAGDLYVGNYGNDVVKVTPRGSETTVYSGGSGQLQVAVDSTGAVYISIHGATVGASVMKVTPGGAQSSVGLGVLGPTAVAVDAGGNVFIADDSNSRLLKVTPLEVQTSVLTGVSGIDGIALGPSSPFPVGVGQGLTLNAYAVPGGTGAPTGTVTFMVGSTALGTATLQLTSSKVDQATLSVAKLNRPLGPATISASYGGDTTYLGSTSSARITVGLSLSPAALATGVDHGSYNSTLTASGGTAPYKFALASGTLPPGLTISTTTGRISVHPRRRAHFR